MTASTAVVSSRPSFYSIVPNRDRADDLFRSYIAFLEERNGDLFADDGFAHREAMMDTLGEHDAIYRGGFDNAVFNRNYVKLQDTDLSDEQLALLAFVKMNAGEAYGVEVMSEARADLMARPEPLYVLERVLGREENYHTKMLVGAADHFDGIEVEGAWRPAWPLKLLIFALAKFPPSMFHPILLGAEISGVFTMNWMLGRLSTMFPDDPGVRESMEHRIIEVLIDEVGHVAYNRICVGTAGMRAAKVLARGVSKSHDDLTPELNVLGYAEARKGLASFDYADLPEEVRRKAWFA
ncbi:MAG: hypothetical protein KDA24_02585 [Deltaproteobacteria bacterium]|nr:hypothetical protein [Deltaproteobacteria bacterium]